MAISNQRVGLNKQTSTQDSILHLSIHPCTDQTSLAHVFPFCQNVNECACRHMQLGNQRYTTNYEPSVSGIPLLPSRESTPFWRVPSAMRPTLPPPIDTVPSFSPLARTTHLAARGGGEKGGGGICKCVCVCFDCMRWELSQMGWMCVCAYGPASETKTRRGEEERKEDISSIRVTGVRCTFSSKPSSLHVKVASLHPCVAGSIGSAWGWAKTNTRSHPIPSHPTNFRRRPAGLKGS